MSENIIEVKNLTKTFVVRSMSYGLKNILLHLPRYIRERAQARRFKALDNISFTVKRGERIGLSGHNGCGKTTLLSILGGVYSQYQGVCTVRGRVSMMLALGAGFNNQLSGRENIILNGVLQGKTIREMRECMDDIIEFSGVGEFIDAPVYQYSSGMLARLGFGVITAIDPEILLVDEVMAVGDKDFRQKCEARMEKLLANGTTLVLVSHSQSVLDKYCDRIITMDHGRIVNDTGSTDPLSGDLSEKKELQNAAL